MLNAKGRIYYKEYKSIVEQSDTAIPQNVFPPSLFYELPCYLDGDDIFLLTTDVET